ncbi:MAG TPA: hypothetical protein DD670_04740, partial [Planctomycetaceae bacterium]|nr:hypothetical protein [Planctomycetaceae bacterium]
MTQIEILIAPDGATTVQTLGFTGASCREASRFIEQALGKQVGEKRTAEFHQQQP